MTIEHRLQEARLAKKGSYQVRTRFIKQGEPLYTNRLIEEASPYLLQHAHNPVNWYPWSDEAFAVAAQDNKPVFLSIGYSTCHWCHVMEEESFDNEQVAELLNRHFISIKVDREQRPDLDEIYMTGVQLISGQGGWPMSSFLTPEGKPFYAATYFPRSQFISLLQRIHQFWELKREAIETDATSIANKIQQQLTHREQGLETGQTQINQALALLKENEDTEYGGFGNAPKFPNECQLLLILDQLERTREPVKKQPLWTTLNHALSALMQGGIYDQLAGGFHRYATDRRWQVPHFEKMLYNQAQLVPLYARAWRLSGGVFKGNNEYRRICIETLDYVLREMCDDSGAFFSATDADSEGQEGKFFVWSWRELKQRLDDAQMTLIQQVYGVTKAGNFEGSNILFLPQPLPESARQLNLSYEELQNRIDRIKHVLYPVRQQRPKPLCDEKIITEWNGMMISALAEAGAILGNTQYVRAAERAAEFIRDHHCDTQGRLHRVSCQGIPSGKANLEDYSHYLLALIRLYDATGKVSWLDLAEQLWLQLTELFADPENGGFYASQQHTEGPLIVRAQPYYDGATPSGNAVTLGALVALNERRFKAEREHQINQLINRFSALMTKVPSAMCHMLTGLAHNQMPNPAGVQYAAKGAIRIDSSLSLSPNDTATAVLALTISEGWRIGGSLASDSLIATEVKLEHPESEWRLLDTQFPAPESASNQGYSGTLEIALNVEQGSATDTLSVLLSFQACSSTHCLAPEQIRVLLR